MERIEIISFDAPKQDRRADSDCICMDCMFWYRCKRGGIDCGLKP